METKDHYYLARLLASHMKLNKVKEIAFVIGNLIPDINPFSYISQAGTTSLAGHSYTCRKGFIENVLQGKYTDTPLWWYRAGEMMHYLVDSFTRPHNQVFDYSLKDHVEYEHQLHQALITSLDKDSFAKTARQAGRLSSIKHWLTSKHDTYIKESRGIPDDCNYILQSVTLAFSEFL